MLFCAAIFLAAQDPTAPCAIDSNGECQSVEADFQCRCESSLPDGKCNNCVIDDRQRVIAPYRSEPPTEAKEDSTSGNAKTHSNQKSKFAAEPGEESNLDPVSNNALPAGKARNLRPQSANVTKRTIPRSAPYTLYSAWNGFEKITNIAELANGGSLEDQVTIYFYLIDGRLGELKTFTLKAGEQLDIILNDLGSFVSDSYGLILYSSTTGETTGRLSYYSPGETEGSYSFVFSIPFTFGMTGASYVTFNTHSASTNPADSNDFVANWLSLINISNSSITFTIRKRSESGALLTEKAITLPPFGRLDEEAGHVIPGRNSVGLIEIIPSTTGLYLAQLMRYGMEMAIGTASPRFKYGFFLRPRSVQIGTQFAAVSKMLVGELPLQSWIEIASVIPHRQIADVRLASSLPGSSPIRRISLEPFSQQHLNANELLGEANNGIALVHCDGCVMQVMSYLRDESTGGIFDIFGSEGEIGQNNENSVGSWNGYLGMRNILQVIGSFAYPQEISIAIEDVFGGSSNHSFVLPAYGFLELALEGSQFATASDSYGSIKISGDNYKAQVIRLGNLTRTTRGTRANRVVRNEAKKPFVNRTPTSESPSASAKAGKDKPSAEKPGKSPPPVDPDISKPPVDGDGRVTVSGRVVTDRDASNAYLEDVSLIVTIVEPSGRKTISSLGFLAPDNDSLPGEKLYKFYVKRNSTVSVKAVYAGGSGDEFEGNPAEIEGPKKALDDKNFVDEIRMLTPPHSFRGLAKNKFGNPIDVLFEYTINKGKPNGVSQQEIGSNLLLDLPPRADLTVKATKEGIAFHPASFSAQGIDKDLEVTFMENASNHCRYNIKTSERKCVALSEPQYLPIEDWLQSASTNLLETITTPCNTVEGCPLQPERKAYCNYRTATCDPNIWPSMLESAGMPVKECRATTDGSGPNFQNNCMGRCYRRIGTDEAFCSFGGFGIPRLDLFEAEGQCTKSEDCSKTYCDRSYEISETASALGIGKLKEKYDCLYGIPPFGEPKCSCACTRSSENTEDRTPLACTE